MSSIKLAREEQGQKTNEENNQNITQKLRHIRYGISFKLFYSINYTLIYSITHTGNIFLHY
jgi:hypothetical protein